MALIDILLGRLIPSSDERAEKIGTLSGIPIFGLDALGSVAYGPEAALTLLVPLGGGGIHYIFSINVAIIVLLSLVYFSRHELFLACPRSSCRQSQRALVFIHESLDPLSVSSCFNSNVSRLAFRSSGR